MGEYHSVLVSCLMYLVAVPAGVGGALLGDRVVGWVLALRDRRSARAEPRPLRGE